jgi:hypothetical protein
MSALGQKQTSKRVRAMSALPSKADIGTRSRNVRYGPKADSASQQNASLFDHLVGTGEQGRRNGQSERLGGRQVDQQL